MNRDEFVSLYKPDHDPYGTAQEVFENHLDSLVSSAVQQKELLIQKSRGDASQCVVDFLNAAWDTDPVAMRMILVNLVRVNEKLSSGTQIICQEFEGEYAMSALGLINGIMDALDLHLIASRWSNVDEDTGSHSDRHFMGFQIFKHPNINEFDQS